MWLLREDSATEMRSFPHTPLTSSSFHYQESWGDSTAEEVMLVTWQAPILKGREMSIPRSG
jgi:hypothetical protein